MGDHLPELLDIVWNRKERIHNVFPSDLQQKATNTVLKQTKAIAKDWAETQN